MFEVLLSVLLGYSSHHAHVLFGRTIGRLAPLYSQAKRLLTLFEVRVSTRRSVSTPTPLPVTRFHKESRASESTDTLKLHVNTMPVSTAIDQILGKDRASNRPLGTIECLQDQKELPFGKNGTVLGNGKYMT